MSDKSSDKREAESASSRMSCYASPSVLAERLKELWLKRGLTLRKLEAETGINNPYLNQLENGYMPSPGVFTLLKLARFYELTLTKLLEA